MLNTSSDAAVAWVSEAEMGGSDFWRDSARTSPVEAGSSTVGLFPATFSPELLHY